MPLPEALRVRRKSDKVLLGAWLNLAFTALVCIFATDRIAAIVIGCFWASIVSLVAVIAARHLDKQAIREKRKGIAQQ
jgi:hypothetical protein